MSGFRMTEVMVSKRDTVPANLKDKERFMKFVVNWGTKNLLSWLNPLSPGFMNNYLTGFVTLEGVCEAAYCQGSLKLCYQEGYIRYTFCFTVAGIDYEYVGEKRNIRPWNLHRTHTTCYGKVTRLDTNEVVATTTTYFLLSNALQFALSFRLQ